MNVTNLNKLTYRPDLDGLRAVAVLSVFAFHAFHDLVPGGFVGVDIFFVISGYLITRVIINDLVEKNFSLIEFYQNRVVRIFPSLISLLLTSLCVGWFVLFPSELKEIGEYIASGSTFFVNILLTKNIGYFDTLAEMKPLLHLWSLAIEEQFYLLWPLILVICFKKTTKFFPFLIASLILISFKIGQDLLENTPREAFYSLFSRSWELLFGAALGYAHTYKMQNSQTSTTTTFQRFIINSQSLVGIGLIGYSLFYFSNETIFPSWNALFPAVGTLLIINSPSTAFFNSYVLSFRPIVIIGLFSYPLYLWHWPLLVFARITNDGETQIEIKLINIILIFIVSLLIFYIVENPIRTKWKKTKNKKIPLYLILTLFVVGSVGGLFYFQDGFINLRNQNNVVDKRDIQKLASSMFQKCPEFPSKYFENTCVKTTKFPRLALIGDSHAQALLLAFADSPYAQLNQLIMSASINCKHYIEYHRSENEGELENQKIKSCQSWLRTTLDIIQKTSSIKTVVFTNFFKKLNLDTDEDILLNLESYQKIFDLLIKAGKKIIVLTDVPTFEWDPKSCIDRRPFYLYGHKKRDPCGISVADFNEQRLEYDSFMKTLAQKNPKIVIYDPINIFLKNNMYWAMLDGVLLYNDRNHVNHVGARRVVEDLYQKLKDKL
jgi:peptidoglycan/LPS O-acetylase OafA/YrhL